MATLTDAQLLELKKGSEKFLTDKDYGHFQIESLMESIFGNYSTRLSDPTACEWAAYWQALANYAEECTEITKKGLGPEQTTPVKPIVRKP